MLFHTKKSCELDNRLKQYISLAFFSWCMLVASKQYNHHWYYYDTKWCNKKTEISNANIAQ